MTSKTYFNILDTRMVFDRSENDMIANRIHRYYPRTLRPIISRLRYALQELYRQADGAMTYLASYEQEGDRRFSVKESFFTSAYTVSDGEVANFILTIEAPDYDTRAEYDRIMPNTSDKDDDLRRAREHFPNFQQDLVDFNLAMETSKSKFLFGKTKLTDLCIFIGELSSNFGNELFVLDYSFDIATRMITLRLADVGNKTHVITLQATDQYE